MAQGDDEEVHVLDEESVPDVEERKYVDGE